MSIVYSLKTRLRAARAVMDAKNYLTQRAALDHWHVFVSLDMIPMRSDEHEIEYIERQYENLRCEVITWYLGYLEARIEALEGDLHE